MAPWTLENGVPSEEIGIFLTYFSFNKGAKAAEAARNVCAVYEVNAIGESTARKWFSRFKEDRFDISDTPRSGTPSEFDEDRLNTLIHNDPRQRVAICASPRALHQLAREQYRPFLSCIVTGDEKCCLCANIRKRKEWFSPNKEEYVGNVPISPLGTPIF